METKIVNPQHYSSVQDYLAALEFIINGSFFVKGGVTIGVSEISGHTPVTFAALLKQRRLLDEPAESLASYVWGDQFYRAMDLKET